MTTNGKWPQKMTGCVESRYTSGGLPEITFSFLTNTTFKKICLFIIRTILVKIAEPNGVH